MRRRNDKRQERRELRNSSSLSAEFLRHYEASDVSIGFKSAALGVPMNARSLLCDFPYSTFVAASATVQMLHGLNRVPQP
jgi:hypothetical protein